jgi:hemolysin activation/secretion protein
MRLPSQIADVLRLLAFALGALAMPLAEAGEDSLQNKMPVQPQSKSPFQLPPVDLDTSTSDDQTVFLKAVQFHGNTAVSIDHLAVVAEPYLGRNIQNHELEELRQKLSRIYLDLGYVNSGVLSDGKLIDGVMHFKVIEGQLTAINVKGLANLNPRYVTQRLSKSNDGPFNVDILRERFQLLLADPLFQRMNARLIPGAKPGDAILDIDTLRARPYQLLVFANNYRPPSIGSNVLGVDYSYRNLTGQGDLLGANVQTGPEFNGDTRATLSWHMPIGYAGSKISLVLDRGSSAVIEQPTAILDIRSKLSSDDVGFSYPLLENLNQRVSVGFNYIRRENRSTLLGVPYSFTPNEVSGTTTEQLWRCWQDFSYRTAVQLIALRSSFTVGRNNLHEIPGLPAIDGPSQSYRLWLGQVQWTRQIQDNGAQLQMRATLQRSLDHLLALDGISVGGVNTVRGYRENQLVRDQGAYLNVEYDYPLIQNSGRNLSLNVVPFIDFGYARNQGSASTSLSSVGVAGRLRWSDLMLEFAFAKRLINIPTFSNTATNLQDKGVHLQLSTKY